MKIADYQVIYGIDGVLFKKEVEKLLRLGYELIGGAAMGYDKRQGVFFSQTMVKYEEENYDINS